MAIIKCHECGNEVSSEANSRPKCRAKPKTMAFCLVFVLGIGWQGTNLEAADARSCLDMARTGVIAGIQEDMCNFKDGLKEELKRIYAEDGCGNLVATADLDKGTEEILTGMKNEYAQMGEKSFCNGAKESYGETLKTIRLAKSSGGQPPIEDNIANLKLQYENVKGYGLCKHTIQTKDACDDIQVIETQLEKLGVCRDNDAWIACDELAGSQASKNQRIVDARALVKASWSRYITLIENIVIADYCKVVDDLSASAAVQHIGVMMQDVANNAGLINDTTLGGVGAIEAAKLRGKEAFDKGVCSRLTPLERGQIRSLVASLMVAY